MVLHVKQVALGCHPGKLGGRETVASALEDANNLAGGGGLAGVHARSRQQYDRGALRKAGLRWDCVVGYISLLAMHHHGTHNTHTERLAVIGVGGGAQSDYASHVEDVQFVARRHLLRDRPYEPLEGLALAEHARYQVSLDDARHSPAHQFQLAV